MGPHKHPTVLDAIRTALLSRNGPQCFLCLAAQTGLSVFDVTAILEGPALAGFVFQKTTCTRCGARLWCAEYRQIESARLLL